MLRAMLWKEWRGHRWPLVAAVTVTALLPLALLPITTIGTRWRNPAELVQITSFVVAFGVWPAFAAVTGAMVFGQEMGDGSMRFLLSRPVSRRRLWLIKTFSGLAAFVGLIAATGAVVATYSVWSAGTIAAATSGLSRQSFGELAGLFGTGLFGPCVFLFGCAAYCSLFVHRPLTAALAGAVVAGGAAALVAGALAPLLPRSFAAYQVAISVGAPIFLVAGTIGIGASTLRVFTRGDAIRAASVRSVLQPLVVVTLAVVVLGAGPVTNAGLREIARDHVARVGNLTIVDGAIVIPELAPNGRTTRLVRIDARTGERHVVVAGWATMPSVSSEAQWVVYAHFDGPWAALAQRFTVRAVRPDGSDDHAVLEGTEFTMFDRFLEEGANTIAVSIDPGGQLVAAYSATGRLEFAPLRGGAAQSIDLQLGGHGRIVGWTADEPPQLLYYTARANRGSRVRFSETNPTRTTVSAIELSSGNRRTVGTFVGYPLHRSAYYPPRALDGPLGSPGAGPWRWFPMQLVHGVEGYPATTTYLAAVQAGARHPSAGVLPAQKELLDACGDSGWFTAGDADFVYAQECGLQTEGGYGFYQPELWIRDIQTGNASMFTELPGVRSIGAVRTSPDGRRMLAYVRDQSGEWGTQVVARNELPRPFVAGFIPIGWIDSRVALLGSETDEGLTLVRVDVAAGTARPIYP